MVFKHEIENKDQIWGNGEWVSEPDLVEFIYKDYRCRVKRISHREGHNNEHVFGGHLCGYICVTGGLEITPEIYENLDVHGGITYNSIEEGDKNWIGFDCAHFGDYMPSMEYLKKTNDYFKDFMPIPEKFKDLAIFNPKYRNLDFCIQECKKLVDQITETKEEG